MLWSPINATPCAVAVQARSSRIVLRAAWRWGSFPSATRTAAKRSRSAMAPGCRLAAHLQCGPSVGGSSSEGYHGCGPCMPRSSPRAPSVVRTELSCSRTQSSMHGPARGRRPLAGPHAHFTPPTHTTPPMHTHRGHCGYTQAVPRSHAKLLLRRAEVHPTNCGSSSSSRTASSTLRITLRPSPSSHHMGPLSVESSAAGVTRGWKSGG